MGDEGNLQIREFEGDGVDSGHFYRHTEQFLEGGADRVDAFYAKRLYLLFGC